ncbi:hypothetical protein HU200_014710 [Digitaria exilis]|uniref:C3H1-type domain-containing protein n=1 Tax=Digitaria exilis TaxID=1010633 RepID=A0A835KK47_9POAL|nr:hypothetical protein HU200_014710 [Digitaria exilis]
MAEVEDEDEFKDALATPDPPPSSPSPTSKSKTAAAAAGRGLGRRLLASIPLPASLSAAIGRFSTPKPPASNVGLGLLLHAGSATPADGDGTPASDAASAISSPNLPPLAYLQRQHGDDQVARPSAGVWEENLGLAPAEEQGRTAAEYGEKEGVAVDGCSVDRNDFCFRGQEEDCEKWQDDELGASVDGCMFQDQEEVMVEQGATEDFAAVVEDQSDSTAVEQCAGDETRAAKDENAVEVNDEVIEQEGAVSRLVAAEDGFAVGSQEEYVVVAEQSVYVISVQDQLEVVEQCTGDQLRTTADDSSGQDKDLVDQEEKTEYYTALEAVEQCTDDGSKAVKDGSIVEGEERTVKQGVVGALDAAKNGAPEESQEDDAMVAEQNEDCISLHDQHKVVELDDQLRTAIDDIATQDQEMVEQEGPIEYYYDVEAVEQCTNDGSRAVNDGSVVDEKEKVVVQELSVGLLDADKDFVTVESQEDMVTAEQSENGISVQDQNEVVEQCTSDQLKETKDGNFVDEKERVMKQEGTVSALNASKDSVILESQVVAEPVEDDISVQDHKVVEQHRIDQLRTTMNDNAAEDQEEVEQECAIVNRDRDAETDDIAVEDQEKEMRQSAGDESRATNHENAMEFNKKVEDQKDVIDEYGVIKDGIGVEILEKNIVIVQQGGDAISQPDEGNVVEQYASDQLRATTDDNAEKQEVVDQEGAIAGRIVTTDGIAVEDQEKEVEQSVGEESRETKNENGVEDSEKVDQDVIGSQSVMKDGSGVESEEEVVVISEKGGNDISVQDVGDAMEQCTSDQLRTTMDDNAAECQEVVEQEGAIIEMGGTPYGFTVEDKDKEVEQSTVDESRAIEDENAVEDNKNVVDQEDSTDTEGAAEDGSGVESQEDVVVAEQGGAGISVRDEGNVLEQCNNDQLRTTTDDNAAEDQEVVEQEGVVSILSAANVGIAVELREFIAGAEKVEDGVSIQDQDKAVEQFPGNQQRITTDDYAAEDQEVIREKIGLSAGYPQRPAKLNCRFYISTGSCSYGSSCHFNHPQLKAKLEGSSFPSEHRNHEVEFLELNRVGLPIREGARKCTYYMRNGTCRYGKKCCFNHPEEVLDAQLHMPTGWDDNNPQSSPHSKKSPEHATINDISSGSEVLPANIIRMLLPPQNMPPCTEEKEMKVKKDPEWSSASDNSDGCCSADSSDGPLCKQEHVNYSERPECPFLLKYGNCKFASACQYYHPKDKFPSRYHTRDNFPSRYHPTDNFQSRHRPKTDPLLEEALIYPEKPGEPECPFYMKTGSCKFGANCKFHHPKDLTPSMQRPASPKRLVAASEHQPAARTTLQDHMYQQQKYPERPGQPDCRYYMQFGKCKFQSACVFNHPKERLSSGWHTAECPFYMKTGACLFGSACEFYHPKDRCSRTGGNDDDTVYEHDFVTESENVTKTAYPERPGELECSHYMKHGYCKFQMSCKFHHPTDRLSRK